MDKQKPYSDSSKLKLLKFNNYQLSHSNQQTVTSGQVNL